MSINDISRRHNTYITTKHGLWYDNLTYTFKGRWLLFTGMSLTPILKYVQDDFGNLVSIPIRLY